MADRELTESAMAECGFGFFTFTFYTVFVLLRCTKPS